MACVPVGELPRAAAHRRHFVVVGAGKTAIDAVCWLLLNGADSSQLTWVMPRDQWLQRRAAVKTMTAHLQPAVENLSNLRRNQPPATPTSALSTDTD